MNQHPFRRRSPRLGILLTILAGALALSGCSFQTMGGPTGQTVLYADFDDAQNLIAGHSVQLADFKVGSVTGVKLMPGFKARVAMSIKDSVKIPDGTTAEVAVTSLLGENYVRLTLPPGGDLSKGPFMADHASFKRTSVQPQFEQVIGQAGTLINAVAGNDVGTILRTSSTALGGEGDKLNNLVGKTSSLVQIFADQKVQLGQAVDDLSRLSTTIASNKDGLAEVPGNLQKTTKLLNDNKVKILDTIEKLTGLSQQINVNVLDGRVGTLRKLVSDLDPVLVTFGSSRRQLTNLVSGLAAFTGKLPRATYDGQLLLYPILKIKLPDGSIFPAISGGVGNTAAAKPAPAPAPAPQLPEGLKNILPNINQLLGGGK